MGRRVTPLRLIAGLLASAALLSACGAEASDREAFVRAMERQGTMTPEQAECMAVAVFDSGELTESEINNGADDLEGASAFEGVFRDALDSCT